MRKFTVTLRLQVSTALFITLLSISACAPFRTSETLEIYFVDVEGGQATLYVMPTGETLLVDAGYPGQGKSDPVPGEARIARDAGRIAAAAADANVSRIDYLLVSHFHRDHFGGVMELAQLLPIGIILDHGTEAEKARSKAKALELILAYEKVRDQYNYIVPSVGGQIPIEGAEITIVSSAGSVLEEPLAGAGEVNPACEGQTPIPSSNPENPRSTGILLEYGSFRFLNLADLVDQPLFDLVCPDNRIGPIDVYLVPHHGGADAADPATLAAFKPRVAILNNGATKGGSAPIFDVLRKSEGLEDTWQLHLSESEGAENFEPKNIANLDTRTAHWIKLSARADGSFRILNGRTGEWRGYAAR